MSRQSAASSNAMQTGRSLAAHRVLDRSAASTASLAMAACAPRAHSQEPGVGKPDHFAHDTELPWRTISELARLLHAGTITSVELTEFMLQRIETLDATYNSYITVMKAEALRDAQRADRELKSNKYRGPLHGVPIAVKDLCYTKGTKTTAGMAILADYVPEYDATVVTRLRNAGAVILGKLNQTEGAMGGYRHAKRHRTKSDAH